MRVDDQQREQLAGRMISVFSKRKWILVHIKYNIHIINILRIMDKKTIRMNVTSAKVSAQQCVLMAEGEVLGT